MQITVTGRNVDISEGFRNRVEQGLNELVEHYHLNPLDSIVTLSKQNNTFICDITSHIARGLSLRAHGENGEPYTSFTQALDVLSKRLRKYKRRLVDHHKHHDYHATPETVPYFILDKSHSEDVETEVLAPAIIAEMPKEIPKLSVGDAVMRMDLSSESTMVFRNHGSGRLNVIYRRTDGNIGWVDPQ